MLLGVNTLHLFQLKMISLLLWQRILMFTTFLAGLYTNLARIYWILIKKSNIFFSIFDVLGDFKKKLRNLFCIDFTLCDGIHFLYITILSCPSPLYILDFFQFPGFDQFHSFNCFSQEPIGYSSCQLCLWTHFFCQVFCFVMFEVIYLYM